VREARAALAPIDGIPPAARADAALVISELFTAALRQSAGRSDRPIEIALTRLPARLRIEVRSPGPPEGLGGRIVTELAAHWHASEGTVTAWIAV
jgi:anti-sigma regulatory factor (Ser/Thr protein kinase)